MFNIVENAIFLKSGDQQNHFIFHINVTNCGGAGIVVLNTSAIILDCEFGPFCKLGGTWFLGSTGLVKDCSIDTMHITAIAVIASEVTIQDNAIHNTLPAENGQFGDGIVVVADPQVQAEAFVSGNFVENSARAGVGTFGSVATLEDNTIQCATFDLNGEPRFGFDFEFFEGSGNLCGCPAPGGCAATTAGLAPPRPITVTE